MGYHRTMFNWSTASTSLTQMNSGTSAVAGTYQVPMNAKLEKITIYLAFQAATSLAQAGRVELSQDNWNLARHEFSFNGAGLQTVPAANGGTQFAFDYLVGEQCTTDKPITGNIIFFWSPVTPAVYVDGYFT